MLTDEVGVAVVDICDLNRDEVLNHPLGGLAAVAKEGVHNLNDAVLQAFKALQLLHHEQ